MMRRGGMKNNNLRGGNMGYAPVPNMRMGGGNQLGGYQAPFYPQQALNMGLGIQGPQVGTGRRRGGIQAKMR